MLQRGGTRVLAAVGPQLRGLPNEIAVEGRTNHLGVANPQYPTRWELPAARATAVVRHLIARGDVAERRLSATGYGKERPLYPPADPRALRQHRRVEILVVSRLPGEARVLLPAVAPQLSD